MGKIVLFPTIYTGSNKDLKQSSGGLSNEALADYYNAMSQMIGYNDLVSKFDIPVFEKSHSWLPNFQKKISAMKGNAIASKDYSMNVLKDIPETLESYDSIFQDLSGKIKQSFINLNHNYSETEADNLKNMVHRLNHGTTLSQKLLTSNVNRLNSYKSAFLTQNEWIKEIFDKVKLTSTESQQQLSSLQTDIADLELELTKHNLYLTAAYAGAGVSLAIVAIGVGLLYVPEPSGITKVFTVLLSIVGGAGVIASVVGIIYENVKIMDIATEIKKKKYQLDKSNKDLSSLNFVTSQLNGLELASVEACKSIEVINSSWSSFSENINLLSYELSNHPQVFIEKDGERILSTWEDDTARWNSFMKFTKDLKTVDVKIDDKINMIGENA